MRNAGIDLADSAQPSEHNRGLMCAAAVGFGVVCEDVAPLADDPAGTRALVRAGVEAMLREAEVLGSRTVTPVVRRHSRSHGSESSPSCEMGVLRGRLEVQRHSLAFAAVMFDVLAGVLGAVLPAEVAHLGLPARLRAMQQECRCAMEAMNG